MYQDNWLIEPVHDIRGLSDEALRARYERLSYLCPPGEETEHADIAELLDITAEEFARRFPDEMEQYRRDSSTPISDEDIPF